MIPLKFNKPYCKNSFQQKQQIQINSHQYFTLKAQTNQNRIILCKAAKKKEQPKQEKQQQQPEKNEHALICSSITPKNISEGLKLTEKGINLNCDILEFRLDYLEFENENLEEYINALEQFSESCTVPYIVTFRPEWEGGYYLGEEELRLEVLFKAIEMNAPYVDIELKALGNLKKLMDKKKFDRKKKSSTQLIVSYHNYFNTPIRNDTLALLLAISGNPEVDIVKAAFFAMDNQDSVMLLEIMRELKQDYGVTKPMICLSMGEKGQPTRVLAGKYGGYLTFGSLEEGFESAPGQTTVQELRDLYRVKEINKDTKVYGIVANPVSHSKSPLIHNTAMKELGFNGVYVRFLVDDMEFFVIGHDDPDFAGFSVSIPHKQDALKFADEKETIAQQIGAANTLVRQEDGGLMAYNTDWSAAINAIEVGVEQATGSRDLKDKKVVIIGAGGAGRALVFGALSKGAKVYLANRSFSRAEKIIREAPNVTFIMLDKLCEGEISGDVIVNSTSVGMDPDIGESPVPKEVTKNFSVVFDAVYNPMETKFLKEAKENGCVCVSGVEMFVGQAAEQFQLFTGLEPPVELMHKVVVDSLQ